MTPKKKRSINGASAVTKSVDILAKYQSIQVDIQEAANELTSVNESLEQEDCNPKTIQAAHNLNAEMESKISLAASEMDEADEGLGIEIIERIDVNIELIDTKTDLDEAREQLRTYQLQRPSPLGI